MGFVTQADSGEYYSIPYTYGATPIYVTSTGGIRSTFSSNFAFFQGIVTDSQSNVYTSYASANQLYRVTPGDIKTVIALPGYPTHLARDSRDNIYANLSSSNAIAKITAGGAVSTFATLPSDAFDISIDENDNIYAIALDGSYIRLISPNGSVSLISPAT